MIAPATTKATVNGILKRLATALSAAATSIRPTKAPTRVMTGLSCPAAASAASWAPWKNA